MKKPSAKDIFGIGCDRSFNEICLQVFRYQAEENPVYKEYIERLGTDPSAVQEIEEIPFLPIELYKTRKILSGKPGANSMIFSSSGTTGAAVSKHVVSDLSVYEESFLKAYGQFYGAPSDYRILALLPSYLERSGSSLVYMVDRLISGSGHPESGFFLDDFDRLKSLLLSDTQQKTLLIGVSFALLDFTDHHQLKVKNTVVMETGGMKGRRREMTRKELHAELCRGFGVGAIHSEYGMTELLSQGYSTGEGIFKAPPWMRVLVRDANDPLTILPAGSSGGVNAIDLANVDACSFLATSDLGRTHQDGSFEILGRFDYSDVRGCNLMVVG